MFSEFKKWGEFIKISHTVFAMPFALASMLVAARDARGWPGWKLFGLIVLAVFCARTCAMSFNRIVDRKFDAENPRTASRHLPAGAISINSAWTLCAIAGIGFIATAFFINKVCFYLSPVALFFVCFYSVTKRFTSYTHVWLGVALALAPIGAWLAVQGQLGFVAIPEPYGASGIGKAIARNGLTGLLPLLLAAGVVFWLIGFDIIYALQDFEFDRNSGLNSLVVAWGPKNALQAAFLAHMLMWGFLAAFGVLCGFKLAYHFGMVVILGCLVMEHWLARRRKGNWVQNAFFRLNGLISVAFLAVTAIEVVFPDFRLAG
ncbi:MAG: 4-hydroxybenzoate octaprenyltransferase [Verrucomicrobiales bacterium]|nr:4-hydroxybenzoate octaprenyltransferase [Verrucomicrobiales bacterium]|tara:strand:- start:1631 stop:2584 length:954 start_codon:yes stop_codon:yes gene_type:complete